MRIALLAFIILFGITQNKAQQFCALVGITATEHAYINEKGEITYKEKIDEAIFPISNGLGRIKKNNKWGYINYKGEIVIPINFDKAENFSEGLALVKIKGKWGYINTKGDTVIKPIYEHAKSFHENMAIVKIDGKDGFINSKGELIVKAIYANIHNYSNGKAWVNKDGKWGCINKQGNYLIEPQYRYTDEFGDEICCVKIDSDIAYIDSLNNFTIKPNERNKIIYSLNATGEKYAQHNNGLMPYFSSNKYGFCDKYGKSVIPATFEKVMNFEVGYALVKIEDGWNYINPRGQVLFKNSFHNLTNYKNGFIGARTGLGNWGYIDLSGNWIIQPQYHSISYFESTEIKQL